MTGQAKSAPPQDSGSLRKALVQMAAIRGGERFQVITYSEDDGDNLNYLAGKPLSFVREMRERRAGL